MDAPTAPENELVDVEEQIDDEEQDADYTNDCINISLGLRANGGIYKTIHISKVLPYIDAKKDCYEVLNNDVNRVYGDVDFDKVNKQFELAGQPYTIDAFNQQDTIYKNALISSIETFLECYNLSKDAYCLYTASKYDCNKISWRFVLNKVSTTKKGNLHLVKQLDDIFKIHQETSKPINNHILTFDKSIYSAPSEKGMGQKMRMLGTSKPDENRPLVIVKGEPVDTIISYITEDTLFMKPPPPEPEVAYTNNNIKHSTNLSELSDLLEILPKKYLESMKGNPPTVKYGAFQIITAILNSYPNTPELREVILHHIPRPNNKRGDIKWIDGVIRGYRPPPQNVKPLTVATLYYLVEDKEKLTALRAKYPKVYYKEIVGYTLPTDWDLIDDHQNQQGYLEEIPKHLTSVLVSSHLGTGKTTRIKQLIKGQSVVKTSSKLKPKSKIKAEPIKQTSILVICPRITFSQNMYNDYGVENDFKLYSDIKGDLSNENRLFIQMESLHRLENRASYDYIIMDEIESILRQASPSTTHKQYKKSIETFERLVSGAKYVIGMDAFVSNRAIDMFNYLRKDDKKTLIRNNHNPYKRQAIEVDKDELWAKNLETLTKDKKRCITISSSIKKLQGFEAILTENKVKHLSYHSEDNKTLRKSSLQDVNESWAEVDAVLYTSSVSVGINYDNTDKPFSQIFMYGAIGGSIPRDLFQGSLRARTLSENLLTFSIDERSVRPAGCNTEEISLMIDDRNQSIVEYLKGFDITDYNNLSAWNKSVILRNKVEDNISKWEYRRVFCYYLEMCGYSVSSEEYGLESLALPKKEHPAFDNIETIGILKKEELERKMINAEEITEAEKYQLDKYYFISKMKGFLYLLDDEDNRAELYNGYWVDKHNKRRRLQNIIDELRFNDTADSANYIVKNADKALELMSDKPVKIRAIKSLQTIITSKKDFNETEFRDMLKNKETFKILLDVFKTFNIAVEADITKNSNVYYAKKIATVFDSWSYDVFENTKEGVRGGRGKEVKYYSHHYSEGELRELFNTPKPEVDNTVVSNECLIVEDAEPVADAEPVDEAEEDEDDEPVDDEPVDEVVVPVAYSSIIQEVYDFGADDIKWLNEMNSQYKQSDAL